MLIDAGGYGRYHNSFMMESILEGPFIAFPYEMPQVISNGSNKDTLEERRHDWPIAQAQLIIVAGLLIAVPLSPAIHRSRLSLSVNGISWKAFFRHSFHDAGGYGHSWTASREPWLSPGVDATVGKDGLWALGRFWSLPGV